MVSVALTITSKMLFLNLNVIFLYLMLLEISRWETRVSQWFRSWSIQASHSGLAKQTYSNFRLSNLILTANIYLGNTVLILIVNFNQYLYILSHYSIIGVWACNGCAAPRPMGRINGLLVEGVESKLYAYDSRLLHWLQHLSVCSIRVQWNFF